MRHQKEEEDVQKNVITLNQSVAFISCWKNGRQAHWYTIFVSLCLCVLTEEEKHSVNGDGDMGKIKSKSRFTDYVTPLGDPIFHLSDRNEGNGIGKSEIISIKCLAAGQAGKFFFWRSLGTRELRFDSCRSTAQGTATGHQQ